MIPEPAAIIANRPVFLSREESVRDGHVFIGYRMDRNCVKIVYGDSVFKKKKAKMKITGSIIGLAGKKNNYQKKKKLPAQLLARPWPDRVILFLCLFRAAAIFNCLL